MNIEFEPKGFRDVYWCYSLNEPVIIEWHKNSEGESEERFPTCINCNWIDEGYDREDKIVSDTFLTEHTFICHILKPKSS
jgi:hypothetical protein